MTSGPGFRLARSAVFAGVCVVVTGLGHALMSGAGMPVWALGYAFACVTAGAWWLTGRERGAVVVTGATVGTQLALHGLFTLSQMVPGLGTSAAGDPSQSTPSMPGMPGMLMPAPASADSHLAAHMAAHEWSAGMLLAHTLAAVVCGLWLWRGEAAAHRLGRALAAFAMAPLRRALRAFAVPAPTAPAFPPVYVAAVRLPELRVLRHAVVRRGPPRFFAYC